MSVQRGEILAVEEAEWKLFHGVVESLDSELWGKPGCVGEWTPKDVIAHVACWTAEAARQLECIRAGSPSRLPEVEEFNAASYEACVDLTINEVKTMTASAHHRLLEELEVVAPVALSGKVVEMVRECGYGHSAEHRGHIETFIGEQR